MSALEAAAAWCLRLSEGELTPAEQARLETWLCADAGNRAAFEDTVGVWVGVEEAGVQPDVIVLRRSALAALHRKRRPFGDWMRVAAAALAAIMVAGAGGTWLSQRPQTIETGIGERRVVALADGSRVSLDGATVVQVRYRRDRRALTLLHGRAKFDVAKDTARPFTVAAADKTVRATGTKFSVEMLQNRVRVVLYEGHVVVREGAKAVVPLDPGQELADARITPADPVRSLAWEGGQLVFVDEPLASVVERVNRYAPRKLRIGDLAAGQVRVDAVFAAGDTEAFVEGVTGVLPVRAVDEGETITLVSR
jgi:transmembrane sensor